MWEKGEGERLIRIVGAEAQDDVPHGSDHEGVSAHGHGWEGFVADVVAAVVVAAGDGLEGVTVEVEGVSACVVVVDDDVDDVVFLQDEGVGVGAVDVGVGCRLAGCEGCVEGGDLGGDVGDVVEEGVFCTIS